MAWYDEAVFYHIYPLGLAGAPEHNEYKEPVHRLNDLIPWIGHIRELGCTGLYIGPLFESVGHGYETTDYRKLDSRLGTNDDLKEFVRQCHKAGIRVILDGVFNHTGRDFFAFRDILQNRESSRYVNWYCNVNFWGNNEYNDGFSYDNWGGYNLLVKLNLRNPEVRDYLLDVVRFWVSEFDIDGLRLDAADVLDFDFMRSLRSLADEVKQDFWLMGEVIHGDYSRWVNERTLHSVTNYHLHKALYSAHNDHNYFEIAHTIKRQMDLGLGRDVRLYSFVDNHDVERIYTKLRNKAHFLPVHVLLYTLPGIPSVYYGSEFGIEGRKERYSDASLRLCLDLKRLTEGANPCLELVTALGQIHKKESALWYGDYRELQLTTTQYAFARGDLLITVNNSDGAATFDIPGDGSYKGALSGQNLTSEQGRLRPSIPANEAEIWIPMAGRKNVYKPVCSKIGPPQDVSPAGRQEDALANAKAAAPGGAPAATLGGAPAALPTNTSAATSTNASAATSTNASAAMPTNTSVATSTNASAAMPTNVKNEADPLQKMPARATTPKPYEEMTVEELQAEILAKMAANGPVTDRMKQDVLENIYPNSLLNWVRSFR